MQLKIKIGASTDASLTAVFRGVAESATAANHKVTADEKAQQKIRVDAAKEAAKTKHDLDVQTAKAKVDAEAAMTSHLRQLELMRAKATLELEKSTAIQVSKAKIAEARKASAEIERASRRGGSGGGGGGGGFGRFMLGDDWNEKSGRKIGYRMGYWASRNFSPVTPMLSYASRAASNMVRGAGVNLDVGSMVGNTVANQKTVTDIVNSAYIPGASGAAGTRANEKDVMADVKAASNASALDYGQGLEGLQKFTAKTGDLETGRKILKDMGIYARATGTAFEDMVDASADVANALGNVENKDQKIKSVMLAIAGMGKVGAVEIRDLATQMAKIGAASGKFAGGAEKNMLVLTAMAQETRATGGAASATQAATSVASFANTFSKEKRVKAFEQITGRKMFNENNETMGPEEIILESLKATKGSKLGMGKIVADAGARRVTAGFEKIYNAAGGAKMIDWDSKTMPSIAKGMAEKGKDGTYRVQAGLLEVVKEFERLKDATMTQRQAEEAHAASMANDEAKAKLFNNKLQDVADKMTASIMPQLEKVGPAAIRLVESFGSVASWLAGNPLAIVPVALGAAIAKAGVEQTIRLGIENVFKDLSGQGGKGFGGGAGALGNAAAALTIASMAVATFTVGKMFIDEWFSGKQKEQKETVEADITAGNDEAVLKKELLAANVKPQDVEKVQADAKRLKSQEDVLRAPMGTWEKLALIGGAAAEGKNANAEYDRIMAERAAQAEKLRQRQADLLKIIADGITVMKAFPQPPTPPPPGSRTDSPPAE